jgi:hypothetical protein
MLQVTSVILAEYIANFYNDIVGVFVSKNVVF